MKPTYKNRSLFEFLGEVGFDPDPKQILNSRDKRVSKILNNTPLNSLMGSYHIIYADPPWRYNFVENKKDAIERHYPTMSLTDICKLPVKDVAANNCVLFLWATSPKLKEAFKVIEAWGFDYKTCAIWDKQWMGLGYYFRQQHELLLVATKGNLPTPNPSDRVGSVISERRTEHSRKPIKFYEIIESMYPEFNKIELFARSKRDGWSCWGNEINPIDLPISA